MEQVKETILGVTLLICVAVIFWYLNWEKIQEFSWRKHWHIVGMFGSMALRELGTEYWVLLGANSTFVICATVGFFQVVKKERQQDISGRDIFMDLTFLAVAALVAFALWSGKQLDIALVVVIVLGMGFLTYIRWDKLRVIACLYGGMTMVLAGCLIYSLWSSQPLPIG